MEKRVIDVDAILKEMDNTKAVVVSEILEGGEQPLIQQEDSEYSLEELVAELEEEHNMPFNINI